MPSSDEPVCAFCGKRRDEVGRLFAGASAHICEECVALCGEDLATADGAGGAEDVATPEVDPRVDLAATMSGYALDRFVSGTALPEIERDLKTLVAVTLVNVGHFTAEQAATFAGVGTDALREQLRELAPAAGASIRPSVLPPPGDTNA